MAVTNTEETERRRLLPDESFGLLLPYILDEDITDINWNGSQLWVDHLKRGRICTEVRLPSSFIHQFTTRLSNVVSVSFNKYTPLLEAETDALRVSVLHEGVANTGRSISIRKTPAVCRLNKEKIVEEHYCSRELDHLMRNAVCAKMNIVICGLPGVGKTELLKYLTTSIPGHERVITIEDNREIRYHKINPGKDCIELKVDETFTYVDAIKASLRQFPTWILLSEARSVEVKYLLESMSTGTHCITTIHADDVRKIPDRIKNMMDEYAASRLENDIYSFADMGILVRKGLGTEGGIRRFIAQVGFLHREEDGINRVTLIAEDGCVLGRTMPPSIDRKFRNAGIAEPFSFLEIPCGADEQSWRAEHGTACQGKYRGENKK